MTPAATHHSLSPARGRAQVIAYYLPQFHVIPENAEWWGEGFTDWVNVRRARPLFPGHYQPRVPRNRDYYDLTDIGAIERQVATAKEFGLSGFCHYHYWFNGRRLLERPTEMVMARRDIDFGFCLAWANATWSRKWTTQRGRGRTLLRQVYSSRQEEWLRHFECLFAAWSDDRHLRVDGKPLFLIYDPHHLPHTDRLFDFWREMAQRRGLGGLHIVGMQHFPFVGSDNARHFDAMVFAQPGASMFVRSSGDPRLGTVHFAGLLRALPTPIATGLQSLRSLLPGRLRFHDYDELWRRIIALQAEHPSYYAGAFVDFDNTPRYERTARIVRGASPDRFEHWFKQLIDGMAHVSHDRRLVFVNAWNEWAEGAYLEPDERYQFGYLEAIRRALT